FGSVSMEAPATGCGICAATEASQAWRPWRSYAVLRAWSAGTTAQMPQPVAGASIETLPKQ
ncbi:MAG: hypothetical protein EOO29_48595, partial [Comamonadaceae bacterium]